MNNTREVTSRATSCGRVHDRRMGSSQNRRASAVSESSGFENSAVYWFQNRVCTGSKTGRLSWFG